MWQTILIIVNYNSKAFLETDSCFTIGNMYPFKFFRRWCADFQNANLDRERGVQIFSPVYKLAFSSKGNQFTDLRY